MSPRVRPLCCDDAILFLSRRPTPVASAAPASAQGGRPDRRQRRDHRRRPRCASASRVRGFTGARIRSSPRQPGPLAHDRPQCGIGLSCVRGVTAAGDSPPPTAPPDLHGASRLDGQRSGTAPGQLPHDSESAQRHSIGRSGKLTIRAIWPHSTAASPRESVEAASITPPPGRRARGSLPLQDRLTLLPTQRHSDDPKSPFNINYGPRPPPV